MQGIQIEHLAREVHEAAYMFCIWCCPVVSLPQFGVQALDASSFSADVLEQVARRVPCSVWCEVL